MRCVCCQQDDWWEAMYYYMARGQFKISHKNTAVVTSIIESLSAKYGDIIPLSINCGKVHKYLGMAFDFIIKADVCITMFDQINNIIKEAPDIYKTGVGSTTTYPKTLYTVRLPYEVNEILHECAIQQMIIRKS